MERRKKILLVLNVLLIFIFTISIAYLTIKLAPLIKDLDKLHKLIASYGSLSILVFIIFQIIQVVVAAIPGEVVQIGGGYIYGTFWGTVYSCIGILIGALIVFYISRLLGYTLVKNFVPQKELEKFNFLINSRRSEVTMFLLFLIPGIPKDFLVYIAGITPIKPENFFLIFAVARFPGILGSSFIGANIQEKDYLPVIIASTIACVLFLIGILKKDLIVNKLQQALHFKERPEKES